MHPKWFVLSSVYNILCIRQATLPILMLYMNNGSSYKRLTFCICICNCIIFPFAGGPLCFYWLSACVGSHEKREGQVKAKGDLLFEKFSIISWLLLPFKIGCEMYVTQVDMISLGTYLKRFNFKLHSKQVGKKMFTFNWTRTWDWKKNTSFGGPKTCHMVWSVKIPHSHAHGHHLHTKSST